MTKLQFSPETKIEICKWAQDVAGTVSPKDSYSFEYEDMVGAALDQVDGLAQAEVKYALDTWGWGSVINYAGTFVPNYLPE